jgi:lipopolysaccharide heptosyltransferase II
MSRNLLRFIDGSLGRTAARVLGVLDRVLQWSRRDRPRTVGTDRPPKNILAIKIVGIGDTVLMLTSLARLRRRFPDTRISVLVTPLSAGIIARQQAVDDVIVYDLFGKDRGLFGLLALIRTLRRRGFDCVLDFEQHFNATALLSYLSGAPRRIGFYYGGGPRKRLFTDPVFLEPRRHMVDSFVRLLEPLGIEPGPVETLERIFVGPDDEEAARDWLRARKIGEGDSLFGIHAGSGPRAPRRRWPPERFAEIVRRLTEQHKAHVILTGSAQERELNEEIIRLAGGGAAHSTAGDLSIIQTAAVISKCSAFLSNDTGPMHIAAAAGVPTVGLFGPDLPCRYRPIGKGNVAIHKNPPCAPCVNIYKGQVRDCDDPVCIKQIDVEEVWNEMLRCGLGGRAR